MSDELPSVETVKEEIGRELVRVHEEAYGETAHNPEVSLHESFVAVVLDIELSPAEITLLDAGYEDSVRATRETFQQAIGATFIAIVERATGRRVESFASRTNVGSGRPWSVEVFRLEPSPPRPS